MVLLMRQDFGSSADALRRALAIAPENTSARHHLSMVLSAQADQEGAIKELERILVLDPENDRARLDLGVYAMSNGDPSRALGLLDAVIAADPESERAQFYRALALDQLDRTGESGDILRRLAAGVGKYPERSRQYLEERAQRLGEPRRGPP